MTTGLASHSLGPTWGCLDKQSRSVTAPMVSFGRDGLSFASGGARWVGASSDEAVKDHRFLNFTGKESPKESCKFPIHDWSSLQDSPEWKRGRVCLCWSLGLGRAVFNLHKHLQETKLALRVFIYDPDQEQLVWVAVGLRFEEGARSFAALARATRDQQPCLPVPLSCQKVILLAHTGSLSVPDESWQT